MSAKPKQSTMKQFVLYAIAALVLTSCDNASKKAAKNETGTEESIKLKKPLTEKEAAEVDASPETATEPETAGDVKVAGTQISEPETNKEAADNNASGWSKFEREAFVKSCYDEAKASMGQKAAKDYCSCMQDKIEAFYPNAEEANKMSASKMTELAKQCLSK